MLVALFFKRYASNEIEIKDMDCLYTLSLNKNESLKEYVSRFKDEAAKVEDLDDRSATIAFKNGLPRDSNTLWKSRYEGMGNASRILCKGPRAC